MEHGRTFSQAGIDNKTPLPTMETTDRNGATTLQQHGHCSLGILCAGAVSLNFQSMSLRQLLLTLLRRGDRI